MKNRFAITSNISTVLTSKKVLEYIFGIKSRVPMFSSKTFIDTLFFNENCMDKKTRSQLYHCWYALKNRCENPRNSSYEYYGKKGIGYDKKWNTFQGFLDDMLPTYPGYERMMSIDRKYNSVGYCKDNCQWMPLREQNAKHSRNIYIEYNGMKKNMAEWERYLGMKKTTFGKRIRQYGYTPQEAIEMAVKEPGIIMNGVRVLFKDLEKKHKIDRNTIHKRIEAGSSIETALDKIYWKQKTLEKVAKRIRKPNGTFS